MNAIQEAAMAIINNFQSWSDEADRESQLQQNSQAGDAMLEEFVVRVLSNLVIDSNVRYCESCDYEWKPGEFDKSCKGCGGYGREGHRLV